jgi:hypothetical protein
MDLTLEREYKQTVEAIRKHEEDLEGLKARRQELEDILVGNWADQGCNGVTVDGQKLYLREDIYATTPQGKPAAVAALQASEFADIVKPDVNGNTLNALVRELARDGKLPSVWEGVIGTVSKWRVGMNKK